jgi:cystathionine beta-lyase
MAIIPSGKIRRDFRRALLASGIGNPNIFCLDAVKAAYEYGEPWLKDLLGYLEGNVTFMRSFVAEEIPRIRMIRPEGTYLMWLDCRSLGLERTALEQLLLMKARLVLNQGHTFGPGGEGFVRMNVGCPRAMLEDGLNRLANAVRGL